jgi:hypothetical protein
LAKDISQRGVIAQPQPPRCLHPEPWHSRPRGR